MNSEILKQNTLTRQDFVGMLLDELHNSGVLEDKSKQEIELITNRTYFELIQKHCTRDIETMINQMKDSDDLELEEFEYWFGLDVEGYIKDLTQESNWRNVIVLIVGNYEEEYINIEFDTVERLNQLIDNSIGELGIGCVSVEIEDTDNFSQEEILYLENQHIVI